MSVDVVPGGRDVQSVSRSERARTLRPRSLLLVRGRVRWLVGRARIWRRWERDGHGPSHFRHVPSRRRMKGWVTACAHLPRATNVLWAFRHADAMGVLEVKARPVDLTNCKRVPLASNAYDRQLQSGLNHKCRVHAGYTDTAPVIKV